MPSSVKESATLSLEEGWASWYDGVNPNSNLSLIKSEATDGYCYLKFLCYFPEFGTVDPVELSKYLACLKSRLGVLPAGIAVVTEMCIGYYTVTEIQKGNKRELGVVLDGEDPKISESFTAIYDRMVTSEFRMEVEVADKVVHISGEPKMACKCPTVVCQHGWSVKGVSSLMTAKGIRVGASGFNMEQFLNGGMDDDDDFEEVYSSLSVKKEPKGGRTETWINNIEDSSDVPTQLTVRQNPTKSSTTSHGDATKNLSHNKPAVQEYLRSEGYAPQPNDGRPPGGVRKMITKQLVQQEEENPKSAEIIADLQVQMKALTEVVSKTALSIQESLTPGDSASVMSRYEDGRRFMASGTVLNPSPVLNHHGASSGATALTVDNHLVAGFTQDRVSLEREQHFVNKLKPVNGLPRPFVNNRLNFLINFSTGLFRSLDKYPDEMLKALYKSMGSESIVPVDCLVKQVLCITIDRHEGVVVSNPFRLPYIEIGMHISQAALTAMIDLLMLEFRQIWFQEFKGLKIPEFWNTYQGMSQDPIQQISKRHTEPSRRESRQSPPKGSRTKTTLGF